jgi:hypothetical protein
MIPTEGIISTYLICIFNSQYELPASTLSQKIAEQRRPQSSNVHDPRG